ncbi:MAG: helix-turn-helix transcriptional regulator, partial [Legionellales bacterium]|nr:helix-turn-helix transcriptional regulator [Legionellales bacterium]
HYLKRYLFLKNLNLLDTDLLNIKLTNREIECINLYLHGNAAKDTAKILSISRRTVETHMNNIKSKLKINYKKDLFKRCMILKDLEII